MINHFEWKPLYESQQIPGWSISFFYNKKHYKGIYHKDGSITWTGILPEEEDKQELAAQIHELMLYHVYDNQ